MAATIEEIKRLLVNEKVARIMDRIPYGDCPTAYYSIKYTTGCMSEDPNDNCKKCKARFRQALYEHVDKEVMAL